ncbi:hypothetical protein EJ05DRAFT_485216 [Pseudovirgaria hyperparasitica]|uniref:Uncharacterized protein n=1 Tax=Pseudovirgaria hyperparasitica TaxID=470096 RepID=A0A6A6WAU1_9PEZI|nr:uncharacterized protein EJ05DRAFT_485216 [Pseudovirgaria hyperparasitica]KAF2759154.1 hypothetical protein EJ05DRAFT_485216 [Pseudovirgaria hyperparasitica]
MDAQKQQVATPPPHHPIDAAQAMLNLVLLQTGRFFADPALRDSKRAQSGLKKVIPAALSSYHNHLDELSTKIKFAQRVIRRDLAVKQKEREKREAEAAEKQKTAPAPAVASPQKPDLTETLDEEKKSTATQDVDMEDVGDAPNDDAKPSIMPEEEKNATSISDTRVPQPVKPPPIQTQTNEQSKKSDPEIEHEATNNPLTATDDLFGKTPTTAGIGNVDIDKMFEDLSNDQDMDTNDNDNDLGFAIGDNASNSLLAGLEDYANSGGDMNLDSSNGIDDFTITDLQVEVSNPNPTTSAPATTTLQTTSAAAQQAATTTTDAINTNDQNDFNDLFSFDQDDSEDWMNGPTGGDGTAFDDAFLDPGE